MEMHLQLFLLLANIIYYLHSKNKTTTASMRHNHVKMEIVKCSNVAYISNVIVLGNNLFGYKGKNIEGKKRNLKTYIFHPLYNTKWDKERKCLW